MGHPENEQFWDNWNNMSYSQVMYTKFFFDLISLDILKTRFTHG